MISYKKPIIPTNKEMNINPSSRSAKLRCAQKIDNFNDFSEFFKKFENLLKIEKFIDEI